MDESTALSTLLQAFRERDIPFNQNELTSIARSEEGRAWIEEYLSHETLLTKDELTLYSALEESGEAAKLADGNDLSIVYPHDDNELKAAIEELQRSTAAIQKQSETLRVQQDAMKSLVKSNRSASEGRARADNLQQQKWTAEREQLSQELDEVCEALAQTVSEQSQQRKATDASLNQTAAEFLRADDRLLSSLQKLAGELDAEKPEDAEVSNRIHNLCARLIKYTVQGIRARLDRIYLEALQSPEGDTTEDESSDAETQALQEELESLYSEILPVAQMGVEQQYLQPALRTISLNQNQGQDRSAEALEYIHKCLVFINTRLSTLTSLIHQYKSHQTVLSHLITHTQKNLHNSTENSAPTKSLTPPKAKPPTSPSKQRSPSKTKRRSSTSFDYFEDAEAEAMLLRSLGLSLPSASMTPSPPRGTSKDLSNTKENQILPLLQTRRQTLQTHMKSLTQATESTVSTHIHDARVTLQLLRDSLFTGSEYGGIRLGDREVEEAVEALEGDLREVVEGVEDLGLGSGGEMAGGKGRNFKREEFVERWGGRGLR